MWAYGLLGVVQGLTEFLPISSSGHLILFKRLLGVDAAGAAIEVALHIGTLVALLFFYRDWLGRLIRGLMRGEREAWRMGGLLVLASVPAALAGMVMGHWIESYFTLAAAAWGWAGTAVLLFLIPGSGPGLGRLKDLSWWQVWWIGMAQALALWPGLSRSGSTMAMARFLGLAGEDAAQLSFLMAIPAVIGASAFESSRLAEMSWQWGPMAIGALMAAISGFVAIQWITSIVKRPHAWHGFAGYVAALAIAVWIFGG